MIVGVNVEGQSLRWYDRSPKIANMSIRFVKFKFNLSPDWDGYEVTAQFTQKETYSMLLDDDYCDLPSELTDGPCLVSVFGYKSGQEARATVIPLVFSIEKSGFVSDGKTPIPPTPDLYAQLLSRVNMAMGRGVPTIQNGTWWLWNAELSTYVDSGVSVTSSGLELDPTLTKEGFAADAKAVGERLAEKEPLVLRVTISSNDYGATFVSSHSASEIAAHYNAGGSVIAVDSSNRFSDIRWVNDSSVTFENTYIDNVYGDVYFVYFLRYEVFEDKSVTKTSKGSNIIASDEIWQFQSGPVTGKGVYNYAVPIPETAEVGQVLAVKAVNGNGKPYAWEPVDMSEAVTVDSALNESSTNAVQNSVVTKALSQKSQVQIITWEAED